MLGSLAVQWRRRRGVALLAGTGKQDTHLLVIMTSDRGFAALSIFYCARSAQDDFRAAGRWQRCQNLVRRPEGLAQLRRDYASVIVDLIEDVGRQRLGFDDAQGVANRVLEMFEAGEFDVCTLVYNTFQSAISQIVTRQQLIPFAVDEAEAAADEESAAVVRLRTRRNRNSRCVATAKHERTGLPVAAGKQCQRTRRADERDGQRDAQRRRNDRLLTLNYNRTRQAFITKELIEIISGAGGLIDRHATGKLMYEV